MKEYVNDVSFNNAASDTGVGKTWFIDLDGTVFFYQGYKGAPDILLEGVAEFFAALPKEDMIIITTSRTEEQKAETEKSLRDNNIPYDHIIFGLPPGKRFVVNDYTDRNDPSAFGVNVMRNRKWESSFLKVLFDVI